MCIINEIKSFVVNGAETLRKASKGRYDLQTEEVEEMRRELFERPSSRIDDAINLRRDRYNVSRDVRVSFDKLILNNG